MSNARRSGKRPFNVFDEPQRGYHSVGRAIDITSRPIFDWFTRNYSASPALYTYRPAYRIPNPLFAALLVALGVAVPNGWGTWRIETHRWAVRFMVWRGWIKRQYEHFDHLHMAPSDEYSSWAYPRSRRDAR